MNLLILHHLRFLQCLSYLIEPLFTTCGSHGDGVSVLLKHPECSSVSLAG